MGIRTVRLDEDTEKVLAQIVTVTGLSVSAPMKKSLAANLVGSFSSSRRRTCA